MIQESRYATTMRSAAMNADMVMRMRGKFSTHWVLVRIKQGGVAVKANADAREVDPSQ